MLLFYFATIVAAIALFGMKKVREKLSVLMIQIILLSAAFVFSTTLPPEADLSRMIHGIEVGMLLSIIVILALLSFIKRPAKARLSFPVFFLAFSLLYLFIKLSGATSLSQAFPEFALPLLYFMMALGAAIAVHLRGKSVGI